MIIQFSSTAVPISGERVDGQTKSRRYKKELIRTGKFRKDSTDQNFEVTPAHLTHWADTFDHMNKAGVKVPVPSTHAGAKDPDKNRGWVTDMFVEGDSLMGVIEAIGDDGIAAISRADVSIEITDKLIDGKGTTYTSPITHVALVTDPVIPGLKEFVPLAASRGTTMDWSKLKKALRFADSVELNDDTAADLITKMVDELRTQAAAAKSPEKKTVDPTVLSLSRELRTTRIDSLVTANKITPAVAKELKTEFCGDDDKLSLSLGSNGDEHFKKMLEIVSMNQPIPSGEKTGRQVMTLSNEEMGKNPLIKDADARAAAVKK